MNSMRQLVLLWMAAGLGITAHAMPANLSEPEAIAGLVERILADRGRIDVLINNAGIFEATPLDLPDADMIAICAHKLGGPPGIGALLVKIGRAHV